jgi:hypothetical protein
VLLKACGRSQKPVLLKRGLSSSIEELLMAAEYILSAGNPNVVLVERGIRTYETATRNTLDLNAVPVLKDRTHLPIVVDPSHGTGHRPLVRPMAVAGVRLRDGLDHRGPPRAAQGLVRLEQSLLLPEFGDLMDDLRRFEYLRNHVAAHCPTSAPPQELERLRSRIDDVDARMAAAGGTCGAIRRGPADASPMTTATMSAASALLERAAKMEGGILTAEEREMVFSAMLRALRSAQRREASTAADPERRRAPGRPRERGDPSAPRPAPPRTDGGDGQHGAPHRCASAVGASRGGAAAARRQVDRPSRSCSTRFAEGEAEVHLPPGADVRSSAAALATLGACSAHRGHRRHDALRGDRGGTPRPRALAGCRGGDAGLRQPGTTMRLFLAPRRASRPVELAVTRHCRRPMERVAAPLRSWVRRS